MDLRTVGRRLSLFCFGLLVLACRSPGTSSYTKDLLVDGAATNVALLLSGSNLNSFERSWAKYSIKRLKDSLESIRGNATLSTRIRHDVTTEELLQLTTNAAKAAGPDGTLIWYVATHGWTKSFATASGEEISPQMLMDALYAGRTTPIKRLVMLFDYCGSGGMVKRLSLAETDRPLVPRGPTELRDLSAEPAPEPAVKAFVDALAAAGSSAALQLAGSDSQPGFKLYETALYFSATTDKQTTAGATFTEAIANVVLTKMDDAYTIRQFLNDTVAEIKLTTTDEYPTDAESSRIDKPQKAMFRALPTRAFLDEPLMSIGY